jgi:hypothetical protein
MMKKIYLLPILALLPLVSSAQGTIGYSYDAAGNRVKREIVVPVPKAMAKQQTFAADGQAFTDMLRDHTVKIYPNPTEGALQVSISGLTGTDKCSLGVYTSQGAQVLTENVKSDHVDIDISNHPAGVYLLRITINNHSTTWKIIKKS